MFLDFPDRANIEFSPSKLVKYITRDHLHCAAAQHIEKVCVDKKILERKKVEEKEKKWDFSQKPLPPPPKTSTDPTLKEWSGGGFISSKFK